jgi:hypothetical protein
MTVARRAVLVSGVSLFWHADYGGRAGNPAQEPDPIVTLWRRRQRQVRRVAALQRQATLAQDRGDQVLCDRLEQRAGTVDDTVLALEQRIAMLPPRSMTALAVQATLLLERLRAMHDADEPEAILAWHIAHHLAGIDSAD